MSELASHNTTVDLGVPGFASHWVPQWYAIYTRSNFEKRVAAELSSKGVEAYLPTVTETHRWKDRNKQVDVPVFPGYVFVRFVDSPENRESVLRATGVARILGQGSTIEAVPDVEILSIQRLLLSKKALFLYPYLREGSRVRVIRGALRGIEGLLIRIKNENRLVVSIELLSQSVATEIDTRDLELIQPVRGSLGGVVA
jgi:transcription antitermination factor NusG